MELSFYLLKNPTLFAYIKRLYLTLWHEPKSELETLHCENSVSVDELFEYAISTNALEVLQLSYNSMYRQHKNQKDLVSSAKIQSLIQRACNILHPPLLGLNPEPIPFNSKTPIFDFLVNYNPIRYILTSLATQIFDLPLSFLRFLGCCHKLENLDLDKFNGDFDRSSFNSELNSKYRPRRDFRQGTAQETLRNPPNCPTSPMFPRKPLLCIFKRKPISVTGFSKPSAPLRILKLSVSNAGDLLLQVQSQHISVTLRSVDFQHSSDL